jgi:tetratricopeptide (TPR) repeat protein
MFNSHFLYKQSVLCVFIFLFIQEIVSQTPKQLLKKANEAYSKNNYGEATLLYEQGLGNNAKSELILKCADSHLKAGNINRAYERYTQALKTIKSPDPSLALQMAYVAKRSGHFEEALKWFVLGKKDNENDTFKLLKIYLDSFAINDNPPLNENNGRCLEIDATASIDAFNTELIYEWDFGDSTIQQGSKVEHCYKVDGNYTIHLSTIDKKSFLRREKDTSIKVNIRSSYLIINGKNNVKPNLKYTYKAELQLPDDLTPIDYYWDFEEEGKANGISVSHSFKNTKSYKVSLTVGFKNTAGKYLIKSGHIMVNCESNFNKSETLLEIEKQGGKGK